MNVNINDIIQIYHKNSLNYAATARELNKQFCTNQFTRQNVRNTILNFQTGITKKEPKILIFDIETSPLQVYSWGVFDQNIPLNAIIKDWELLCYAGKWLGDDQIIVDAQCYHGMDELPVVESVWKLLSEADVVVAHNAKKFDKKKVNAKFLQYGFPEPNYYKVVDTLQIAKGNFALTSNKLDYIAKLLKFEGKYDTNLQLWIDCMHGKEDAWEKMIKYNKQDVLELENIYLKLRSWDKNHPSYSSYISQSECDEMLCNVCGSNNLTLSPKKYNTATSTFDIYVCGCGHQMRNRQNILTKEQKENRLVNIR